MRTDFIASSPASKQCRRSSELPTAKEFLSFIGPTLCITFTVIFILAKVYEHAKHLL